MTEVLEAPPVEMQEVLYVGDCGAQDIHIKFDDDKHKYLVNDQSFPSVTTILGKHFAKPAIAKWVETKTLQGVETLMRSESGCPLAWETIRDALYANELTADQEKERKGAIGTQVHNAFEVYVKDGKLPVLGDYDPTVKPYIQGLFRFLQAVHPEITHSEVLVASLRHKFAGKFDARIVVSYPVLVHFAVTQDGRVEECWLPAGVYLIDLKTSNSIYPEVGMQLAGYEQGAIECGLGKSDGRLAIHLTPEGDYVIHQFAHNRGDFNAIVALYHRHINAGKRRTKANKKLERA